MEAEAAKKASGNWTWKGNMRFSICDAENIMPKTKAPYASLEAEPFFAIPANAKLSKSPSPASNSELQRMVNIPRK